MSPVFLTIVHAWAAALWILGLLCAPAVIGWIAGRRSAALRVQSAKSAARVFWWVLVPMLLIVWIGGFVLAGNIDWLQSRWLLAKVGVVLAFTGLHAIYSFQLHRIQVSHSYVAPGWLRFTVPLQIVGLVVVLYLILAKP
jgi:uncharacterized membrane protein